MTGWDLLWHWILLNVGVGLCGASVMMWFTGRLPPPLTHKKAPPEFAAFQFVVGMTLLLVFGKANLFDTTYRWLLAQFGG
jgi:hypothetical protein